MAIASNGPLAAITFEWQGKRQMRVYLQDTAGWIREAVFTGESWSKNGSPLVQAKDGSPLTATTWMDGNGAPQIRLYYMNPENIMSEHMYDHSHGWGAGSSLPQ